MRRIGLFYNFLFCLIITSVAQKKPDPIPEKIKQVENNLCTWVEVPGTPKWSLEERMKYHHIMGLSIAVVKDYRIEWTKQYGWADSAEGRKVDVHTKFNAASNSKSLNALGILKLVQDGKLDLNKDINTYLKSWKFPYDTTSHGKIITTADLLSHMAGLSVGGFNGYERGDTIPTLVQILDGKFPANSPAVRSVIPPGAKFYYSGGGVLISQLIIEDITGMKYEDYMIKNVFTPLGMTESFYSTENRKNLATGYYRNGKEIEGKYHIYPEQAVAGLWTTPTDLAKYMIERQLAIKGKSIKVVNGKLSKLQFSPHIDTTTGLGVFLINRKGSKYFCHGGGNAGFVSNFIGSFEGGNGVVVMMNADNDYPALLFIDEVINSVAFTYKWPNFYDPVVKTKYIKTPGELETYEGKYEWGADTAMVMVKDDKLYLVLGGRSNRVYFSDEDHFFIYEAARGDFKFLYDKHKRVRGIGINGKFTAKRIE